MAKRKTEATVEPSVDLDTIIIETEAMPQVEPVVEPVAEPTVEIDDPDGPTPDDDQNLGEQIDSLSRANIYEHRETWLHAAARALTQRLFEPAYEVPANIRISCGFPSRNPLNGANKQALGQCWGDEKSADKHFEIFVSPVICTPMTAVEVLAHEMCHAVAGIDAKHGKLFREVATTIGLEGKMTSTFGGERFRNAATEIIEDIGPYPHGALDARKMSNGIKKQSTRLIKCECDVCGYNARVTSKWLDEIGPPHCPKHGEMSVIRG